MRRKVVTQQMTSRNNCDKEYCVIQGVTVRQLLHKLRNDQQFHAKNESPISTKRSGIVFISSKPKQLIDSQLIAHFSHRLRVCGVISFNQSHGTEMQELLIDHHIDDHSNGRKQ